MEPPARRVVGKAEHLAKGPTRGSVVSSLTAAAFAGQPLYEQEYCGRGDMENRIKEQQLMLFANRVSCSTMRANQVRLVALATVAYVLMRALREYGLAQTELAAGAVRHHSGQAVKNRRGAAGQRTGGWRCRCRKPTRHERMFVRVWERLSALMVPQRPAVVGSS